MVHSRERHSYGARGWPTGLPPVRSLNSRPYSELSLRLSPSSSSVKVRKLNVISTAAKRILVGYVTNHLPICGQICIGEYHGSRGFWLCRYCRSKVITCS